MPCAAISISGEKRIVQTALTGRRGTVNELVNVDSYKVSITAALIGEDGNYPEQAVQQMREMWELNESVMLISALTDLVVGRDDKFVFDKIEFPTMGGTGTRSNSEVYGAYGRSRRIDNRVIMYVLTCDIRIGGKRFSAVNGVSVKRSVYALGATATIKVPVTAVLRQADLPATRVETAQAVAVGDRVEIRLGYDGRNRLEFRGYVKALNLRTPLEIVCEDEFWQCRRRNITASGTTTLAALLKKCGLEVGYAETLTLQNYAVPDKSVSSVLADLTKRYGLAVFFDLDGKVYACRPEKVVGTA